jgi:hypothetical protein
VGEVVIAAYRSVFGRFGLALELGWLPLLVLLSGFLVPELALRYLVVPAAAAERVSALTFDAGDLGNFVEEMIALLALGAFAVRWYQLQLFANPHALPLRSGTQAWLRITSYGVLIYAIAFGLYVSIAWSGAMRLDGEVGNLSRVAVAIVLAGFAIAVMRLSLLFPAAAYGVPLGVIDAWKAMSGNVWRLIGASLLATAPVALTLWSFEAGVFSAVGLDPTTNADQPFGVILLIGVVETAWRFVTVALIVSIASEFYRRVVLPRE